MKPTAWIRIALIVMTLSMLVVLFGPPAKAAEARLKVRMDQPFEINGREFPPGVLTLRQLGAYNPTSTFNEIWVGRECLGVMLARSVSDAPEATSDSLIFRRAADDRLVLVGVTFRGEPARDLLPNAAAARARWMTRRPSPETDDPTLLAAH